jgi:hypothetical protein
MKLFISLLAMTGSLAQAEVLLCPQALAVAQTAAATAGWSVFNEADGGTHPYFFAGFTDGPPERMAALMHSSETMRGKDKVLIYDFAGAQQPWLVCSYTRTSLTLNRKLPAATRQCRVTLDYATRFESVKKIECG